MKKTIAIMAVVISTGAFAQGNMAGTHNTKSTSKGHMMTAQLEKLSLEQQEEFKTLHENHMKDMKVSMLDMKEVDLQIQKEMLAEKPNQLNINKLIDKKSKLQADKQKESLGFRLDMKEKFDIDLKGRDGHKTKTMSKSNSKKNNNKSRG